MGNKPSVGRKQYIAVKRGAMLAALLLLLIMTASSGLLVGLALILAFVAGMAYVGLGILINKPEWAEQLQNEQTGEPY